MDTGVTKVGVSEQQMAERRRDKIQQIKDEGVDPYPVEFLGRCDIAFAKRRSILGTQPNLAIAGRVVAKRDLGKIVFIDIEDRTGMIELHCKEVSRIDFVSLGDSIGVYGTIVVKDSKHIFEVSSYYMLAKAIRDPPDKKNGLKDDEYRYRHREVEMLSDSETRNFFIERATIISNIRRNLENNGYIHVETPVLQPIYGGATARPFVTEHNTLHRPAYLRISSELYLKRYLVGGLDRVFHIGKSFRNEGLSPEHSPEFTMVEFFQTCVDYKYMEKFTRNILAECFDVDLDRLITDWDLPSSDWPLSRKKPNEPSKAEAWEMYLDGIEIASGASDLNDPDEQAKRFEEGSAVKVDGFDEANPYDQVYIESLEYGLMPIAGVGIGIDRLLMILGGKKNIREVIAFPAMR